MIPFIKIFKKLHCLKVKYLVAGGVAVNLHQVNRATMDLDLIVHLKKENVEKFSNVMAFLGFVPKVPVDPNLLGNKKERTKWIEEKNMIVFSFVNPDNPIEIVDVFVKEPLPFGQLYKRRKDVKAFGTTIPVLGIQDLVFLKESADRPKDQFDIYALKSLLLRR
jgi:hypothetical protein